MPQSIGGSKNKDKNTRSILTQDKDTKLLSNLSSPQRFEDGRAAILQELNINHKKDIIGIKFNMSQLINKQLPKCLYKLLAKQNRPKEHKP
jgi:hypothetical protein